MLSPSALQGVAASVSELASLNIAAISLVFLCCELVTVKCVPAVEFYLSAIFYVWLKHIVLPVKNLPAFARSINGMFRELYAVTLQLIFSTNSFVVKYARWFNW